MTEQNERELKGGEGDEENVGMEGGEESEAGEITRGGKESENERRDESFEKTKEAAEEGERRGRK